MLSALLVLTVVFGQSGLMAEEETSKGTDQSERQWVSVGASFPVQQLEDQHEKQYQLGQEKLVVFAAEMEASKFIHKVLESRGDDFLKKHKSLVLADIHRMPGLISALIARPRMRDYNYTIYLIDDEKTGASLPRKPAQLTLFYLENKKIKEIKYVDSAAALLKAIEAVQ